MPRARGQKSGPGRGKSTCKGPVSGLHGMDRTTRPCGGPQGCWPQWERPGREADHGGARVSCSATLANGRECGQGGGGRELSMEAARKKRGAPPRAAGSRETGTGQAPPGRMPGCYLAVWGEGRCPGSPLDTEWEVSHSLLVSSGGGAGWAVRGHSWDTQVTLEAGGGRSEGRLRLKPDMRSQSCPGDLSRP